VAEVLTSKVDNPSSGTPQFSRIILFWLSHYHRDARLIYFGPDIYLQTTKVALTKSKAFSSIVATFEISKGLGGWHKVGKGMSLRKLDVNVRLGCLNASS
jgi:hypothetical protein